VVILFFHECYVSAEGGEWLPGLLPKTALLLSGWDENDPASHAFLTDASLGLQLASNQRIHFPL
jgi:hypothetical protein